MSKIQSNDALDLITLSKAEAKIGEVKETLLTVEQFNAEYLGTWLLMNGQSCVGTAYATLTGKTVVPDMTTDGMFLRQAKSLRTLGSAEGDAIRNITGSLDNVRFDDGVSASGPFSIANGAGGTGHVGGSNGDYKILFDVSKSVPTADENRPKNIAVNFMVKVGY